jgi:hypothetical protein
MPWVFAGDYIEAGECFSKIAGMKVRARIVPWAHAIFPRARIRGDAAATCGNPADRAVG